MISKFLASRIAETNVQCLSDVGARSAVDAARVGCATIRLGELLLIPRFLCNVLSEKTEIIYLGICEERW